MNAYEAVLRGQLVQNWVVLIVAVFKDQSCFTDSVLLVNQIVLVVWSNVPWRSRLHYCGVYLSKFKYRTNCKASRWLSLFAVWLLSNNNQFYDKYAQLISVVSVEEQKFFFFGLHHASVALRNDQLFELWGVGPTVKATRFVHLPIVQSSIVLYKVLSLCYHRCSVVFETGVL